MISVDSFCCHDRMHACVSTYNAESATSCGLSCFRHHNPVRNQSNVLKHEARVQLITIICSAVIPFVHASQYIKHTVRGWCLLRRRRSRFEDDRSFFSSEPSSVSIAVVFGITCTTTPSVPENGSLNTLKLFDRRDSFLS